MFDTFMNYLLPQTCLMCECTLWQFAASNTICHDCFGKMPWVTNPICIKCNKHMPMRNLDQVCCETCELNQWAYDQLISIVYYNDFSAKIAMKLKYRGMGAEFIAKMISNKCIKLPDYILAIPLHSSRLLKRGFNQSELIAIALSKIMNVRYIPALDRVRYTRSQGGLTQKERLKNVSSAFMVKSDWLSILNGKHVLLIDDVMTTGATIHAATLALSNANVSHTTIAVWAKRDLD